MGKGSVQNRLLVWICVGFDRMLIQLVHSLFLFVLDVIHSKLYFCGYFTRTSRQLHDMPDEGVEWNYILVQLIVMHERMTHLYEILRGGKFII